MLLKMLCNFIEHAFITVTPYNSVSLFFRVRKTSVGGSGGNSSHGVVCGSLNDREWTVVSSDVTHSARSTSGVALGQSNQSGLKSEY